MKANLYISPHQWSEIEYVLANQSGTCVARCHLRQSLQKGQAILCSVFVLYEYRGQGYGRALLQSVLDSARSLGYERVALAVADNNVPAISLYRSLGFNVNGEIPGLVGMEVAL